MAPFHVLFMMAFTMVLFGVPSLAQFLPRNVTLDDTDPRIIYDGGWVDTERTVLNFGGGHKLGNTADSVARITFIGDAVYFMSSLWPYHVTTQISLNGGPRVILDLQDYDYTGPGQPNESVEAQAVYSWVSLSYGAHTLEVSVAPGEDFAIFDGIIYTQREPAQALPAAVTSSESLPPAVPTSPDSAPLPLSTSSSLTTSSQAQKPTTASVAANTADPLVGRRIAFIICGIVGGFALCLIGYLLYWCGKRGNKHRQHTTFIPGPMASEESHYNSRKPLRETFMSFATDVEVGQPTVATKGTFQPASVVWHQSIGPRLSRAFSRRRPSQVDTRPPPLSPLQSEKPTYHRHQLSEVPPVPPLPDAISIPSKPTFPLNTRHHSGRYPTFQAKNPSPIEAIRTSPKPHRPITVVPKTHTRSFSALSVNTTNYNEEELYGGIAMSPEQTHVMNAHRNKSTKRLYGNTPAEMAWSPPPPAYMTFN